MTERLRSVADAPVVRAESLTKRFDDVIEGPSVESWTSFATRRCTCPAASHDDIATPQLRRFLREPQFRRFV
jgi:hypothetical protein